MNELRRQRKEFRRGEATSAGEKKKKKEGTEAEAKERARGKHPWGQGSEYMLK